MITNTGTLKIKRYLEICCQKTFMWFHKYFFRKSKAHGIVTQKPSWHISLILFNKKNMLFSHTFLGSYLKIFWLGMTCNCTLRFSNYKGWFQHFNALAHNQPHQLRSLTARTFMLPSVLTPLFLQKISYYFLNIWRKKLFMINELQNYRIADAAHLLQAPDKSRFN